MRDTTGAAEIYRHFKALPGSDYIATEHAVRGLVKSIQRKRPKRVLEVGAGIGTLTFTILSALTELDEEFEFVSMEHNEFCLGQLRINLADQWGRFELFTDLPENPEGLGTFDFIVIDGGNLNPAPVSAIRPRGVIFVEGFMSKIRNVIGQVHAERPWVAANFRSLDRRHGYWLYQFEPTGLDHVFYGAVNAINRVLSGTKRQSPRVADPAE